MSTTYSICEFCKGMNRVPWKENQEPICGKCKNPLPIHHGVNEVSDATLQLLVKKSELPVVTDFWAPWCGPCRIFAPTFQNAAKNYFGRIVFAKMNTEIFPQASNAFQIRGIPTLLLFHKGREIARQSGALPPQALHQWLDEKLKYNT